MQSKATEFIMKNSNTSYKECLIHLNLLPLNYWLDLFFYFNVK